jgi:hypothetical protein
MKGTSHAERVHQTLVTGSVAGLLGLFAYDRNSPQREPLQHNISPACKLLVPAGLVIGAELQTDRLLQIRYGMPTHNKV